MRYSPLRSSHQGYHDHSICIFTCMSIFIVSFAFLGGFIYYSNFYRESQFPKLIDHSEAREAFREFIHTYKKLYSNKEEKEYRFSIFKNNFNRINDINRQNFKFKLGINHLADLSDEEYRQFYLKPHKYQIQPEDIKYSKHKNLNKNYSDAKINHAKYLPPIKDQGMCGSCWTFGCIGAVEGLYNIRNSKTNPPSSFSEQEIVDCTYNKSQYGNVMGCEGGDYYQGYEYIIKNGISASTDYPYLAVDEPCKTPGTPKLFINGKQLIEPSHQDYMLTNLTNQPLSVSLAADHVNFRFYKSGVVTHGCGLDLDHDVLLMGADTLDDTKFWLIRNSWGPAWGDQGYIRLERFYNLHPGICGEALHAGYPIINSKF